MRSRLWIAKLFVSTLGIGYVPILPGTLASGVGVLIYLGVHSSLLGYGLLLAFFLGFGLLGSHRLLQITEDQDPGWIVMDEVVGMLIALFLIPPRIPLLVIGFALFRFFDSVKLFPIDWLERQKGEWGVFLDDVGAGIYTNLLLHLIVALAP